MEVVILCGGRGTRLGKETQVRPKPLIEIGSKPVLWHIMKYYASFGHTDFILCLGYKGEMIKEYFLNYEVFENDVTVSLGAKESVAVRHTDLSEKGWEITLANTGLDTPTGARVKKVEEYITGDEFMLTYGDGVSDVDINALLDFQHSQGKTATVTAVHPPARFGELQIKDGEVKIFSEKSQTSAGLINGGFFACNRRIFKYLSNDESCALEHEPLVRLVADGELAAYRHDGFWQCVDTVRELEILRRYWESGEAPWKVW